MRRLNRATIVAAVTEMLERQGVEAVSTRTIGAALDVHPTALYRHFRDMDELLREAADSILAGVVESAAAQASVDSLDGVGALCRTLRAVLIDHPGAARVMSSGPSRMTNERALTERLLGLLSESGLTDDEVVRAYHALIEFTVGSAAIDTMDRAGAPDEADARHRTWRADYLVAPPDRFPHTTRLAASMYPSQNDQFAFGLNLMICGLRERVRGRGTFTG
ncbi:MAG TPA: TetR/AcrR family transcriptional regulator C-terminal domain-containing protein [Actinoplanes sp.]|jgi:AcrR family transcriptional regulator